MLACVFATVFLQILQARNHYMSNEVAITKATVFISPFGTEDVSRCSSSHLSQIPLKFKVNFWSFSTDFKGISVTSSGAVVGMNSVHRCLRSCVFNCLVSGNSTATADTIHGIYYQSTVKKFLLGLIH